jgi:chromosome partitioning protein
MTNVRRLLRRCLTNDSFDAFLNCCSTTYQLAISSFCSDRPKKLPDFQSSPGSGLRCALPGNPKDEHAAEEHTVGSGLSKTGGVAALVQRRIDAVRPSLKRVIAFINGKGGTGKTTIVANMGGVLSEAHHRRQSGKRVLLIEMDPQGNIGLDLGTLGNSQYDEGASILHAVLGTGLLNVMRDVRPNMDLIPGGRHLNDLGNLLTISDGAERADRQLRFVEAVAEIAAAYDWILVDCPPGEKQLQVLALALARWAVIPVSFDAASRYGLERVAERFIDAGPVNPDLDLLGLLMFKFNRADLRRARTATGEESHQEGGRRKAVREKLLELLQDQEIEAPVFKAVISTSITAATVCREIGHLVFEIADASAAKGWRAQAAQLGGAPSAETVEALAVDYEDATVEIISRAKELEDGDQ